MHVEIIIQFNCFGYEKWTSENVLNFELSQLSPPSYMYSLLAQNSWNTDTNEASEDF